MIKSIVTALDGSEESLAGLEQAALWSERLDAGEAMHLEGGPCRGPG